MLSSLQPASKIVVFASILYFLSQPLLVQAEVACVEPVDREAALTSGINAILLSHSNSTYIGEDGTRKEPIHYRDIAELYSRNPDCCTFSRFGEDDLAPSLGWSERNAFYGFARATFAAYWSTKAGERRAVKVTRITAVNVCGNAISYDVDDDEY